MTNAIADTRPELAVATQTATDVVLDVRGLVTEVQTPRAPHVWWTTFRSPCQPAGR